MIVDKKNHIITFKKLTDQNVLNGFTLKPFNFREGYVSEKDLEISFNKIQSMYNYKLKKIIKAKQIHSTNIAIVKEDNINNSYENVDGFITNLTGVLLVTYLADCQGIFLYDREKKVIGNIHSGWKGTLNRIVNNAINIMTKEYYSNPENIEAYICPSILECCFEVDEDVKMKFIEGFKDIEIEELVTLGDIKNSEQKYNIDTVEINKRVMVNLGLKEKNIKKAKLCTKCNSDYIHSYRGEGKNCGRNIGIISLK